MPGTNLIALKILTQYDCFQGHIKKTCYMLSFSRWLSLTWNSSDLSLDVSYSDRLSLNPQFISDWFAPPVICNTTHNCIVAKHGLGSESMVQILSHVRRSLDSRNNLLCLSSLICNMETTVSASYKCCEK